MAIASETRMGANTSKEVREAYVGFWKKVFDLDARSEFGIVGAGSVLRCGVLCFLAYWAPLALLRRKLRDPFHFRSAVAFGLFGFTYRTVRVLISRLASQEKHNQTLHKHSPVVAGCAAAAVAVSVDPSFVSSVFVIWWAMRALRTLPIVQTQVEQRKYGPLAVMGVASAFLAPAALAAPEEHHVSYRRFLQGFFEASGTPFEKFQRPDAGLSIGQTIAGDSSIVPWFARYCVFVSWNAFKLYAPLHLVWALLRLPSLTDPRVIVSNTGRSVAFLSAYVCGMMAMLLVHSHFVKTPPRWQVSLWTPIPTVSLLVERPNRQAELAFFCLSHAVNSVYNHFRLAGVLKPNNVVGTLLLMAATGRIMGE